MVGKVKKKRKRAPGSKGGVLKGLAGGRLLRVESPHAVRNSLERNSGESCDDSAKWVYCNSGDLALEVIDARYGGLFGHTYLSGPASGFFRTTPALDDWFSSATLRRASFSPPRMNETNRDLTVETIRKMMPMKYAEMAPTKYGARADVYVFCVGVKDEKESDPFRTFITRCWMFSPEVGDLLPTSHLVSTSHLVGVISVGGLDRRGHPKCGRGSILVHLQPPHHSQSTHVELVQACLLWEAACRQAAARKIDVGAL